MAGFNLDEVKLRIPKQVTYDAVKIRLIDKPLSVPMKGMPKHGFTGDGHLSGLDVTIQFVQPTRDS